jgi:tetratricopeptide (TPR) repeat protein
MKKKALVLFILLISLFSHNSSGFTMNDQQKTANADSLNAKLAKAQDYVSQGNRAEASKIYLELFRKYPHSREAVQGWIIVNMKREPGGEDEAIKQLEEFEKTYPDNTAIIFFKAFLEAEYNRYEEALKDLEKLIKMQPDTALNYVLKGQVLSSMKKYSDSCLAFDRATSLDPARWDVWNMKAIALARSGNFNGALVSINKGIELSPDKAISIYNRACIYSLKGDKKNALADLAKAISLRPSFKEYATKDEDFKNYYEDEDFRKLTQ